MAARTIDRVGRVLVVLFAGALAARAHGAALDEEGDLRLGVRAYSAARVGTQDTNIQLIERAVYSPDRWGIPVAAAEPEFVHNAADQYLQTLLIGTTYYGGKVSPSLNVLFDWSGSVVVQPNVTYAYDPFRFILNYSYLWASDLRGNSGTSLLRDRDNVLFQLEYVL